MLNETFLEMSYCKYNFGENKIEVLLWGGGGGTGAKLPKLGPLAQN